MRNPPIQPVPALTFDEKLFERQLDEGGEIISIGLGPHLIEKIVKCPNVVLRNYRNTLDFQRSGKGGAAKCVIVETDMFDESAMPRLRQVRATVGSRVDICIVAITSYRPSAFDDYVRLQGANLCVSEDYILEIGS